MILHKESGKSRYVRGLFHRYLPLIYGVCLNYLKDADSAEEAVMQLFNHLLYKFADYDITAFRPWVYDYTKNYCLQLQEKEVDTVAIDPNEAVAEFDKIKELFESEDEKQTTFLADCLKELPQQQRASLNYFFKEKLSYAEIVDKSGYTLKHVKKYIQNGKHNLLICIEKNEV